MSIHKCKYGCGQEGLFSTPQGFCCSSHHNRCPANREKRRQSILGRKHTQATKDKISKANQGNVPWNKGNSKYGDPKPCACGCGEICTTNLNRWISGHDRLGKPNYYRGKKRLRHSLRLLRPNEFGSVGGKGFYHKKAYELFGTDVCSECGKTSEEQLKEFNKSIHMHCKDGNWTRLHVANWENLCQKCHQGLHAKLRKEA